MLLYRIDTPVHIHTIIDGDVKLFLEKMSKKLGVPQNAIINSLVADGMVTRGYMKVRSKTTSKKKARKKKR